MAKRKVINKLKKKSSFGSKFKAVFSGKQVFSNTSIARALYEKRRFGEVVGDKVQYSLSEAMYLVDNRKMEIFKLGKKISADKFTELANKIESNFMIRYAVLADLRDKGYIVKTALKFGADFRVYDKGKRPGQGHAKWIVFPVYESSSLTWHEFAAKNRVAHSTQKNLLIAIVDDEGSVLYYEINWSRP